MIEFYLFENQTNFLDILDKISNVIIALFTLGFSIFIFFNSRKREKLKDEHTQRMDMLKAILLENNSNHLLSFFEKIIDTIRLNLDEEISDDDKSVIIELINDEHEKYRLKFYDIILPFNNSVYQEIKTITDNLIDAITIKTFDEETNFYLSQNINELEKLVLNCRSETLKVLLKIK